MASSSTYELAKYLLYGLLGLQFCAAIAVFIVVKFYPLLIVKGFRTWTRFRAGYTSRTLRDPNSNSVFHYVEKGSLKDCKYSLVFLHGFGDTAEGFCTAGAYFPDTIHTIALDLPGHGNAKKYTAEAADPDCFIRYIKKFMDASGLSKKKVHLAGHSMGGGLTCLYATRYPDEVRSVTFVAPAGTVQAEKSNLEKLPPDEIYSLMVPRSVASFKKLLDFLTYKEFTLPEFLLSAILEDNKSAAEFQTRLLKCGEALRSMPQGQFPHIKVPTLCVWGDDDQLTHVSGSKYIKEQIPHSQICILEKCGHAILLDEPRILAMKMMQFVQELS